MRTMKPAYKHGEPNDCVAEANAPSADQYPPQSGGNAQRPQRESDVSEVGQK